MLIGGGRPRFLSGPLYSHVEKITKAVPRMNCEGVRDLFCVSLRLEFGVGEGGWGLDG